nr:hypothetical protein [Enterococcus sp. JM9B]
MFTIALIKLIVDMLKNNLHEKERLVFPFLFALNNGGDLTTKSLTRKSIRCFL